MAHPVATVFAITMAVWVADARFAPAPESVPAPEAALTPAAAPAADAPATCHPGPTASPSAGADLEIVVCASRIK